jgi:branched-chain amino acid transport system permease protein
MSTLITYLFAGLAVGASFALVASGFVAVHRVTGVVNFAQGALVVLAGLASASFLGSGLPHGLAELGAIGVAAVAGAVCGLVVTARRTLPEHGALVLTLALALAAYSVEILAWGDQPRSPAGLDGVLVVGGVRLPEQQILVIAAAALVFVLLGLLLDRTYLGKALTACAVDAHAARLSGISVRRMSLFAFVLAGVLGGVAGVLISPLRAVSFDSDVPIALSGFAAAVFGGLSDLPRALLGALGLGVAEELVGGYINAAYETDVALAFLLVAMIARAASHRALEAGGGSL